MRRITNEVLGVKIDNIAEDLKWMKKAINENSKFRLKEEGAKGKMAALTASAGIFGAFIMWLMDKFKLFGK